MKYEYPLSASTAATRAYLNTNLEAFANQYAHDARPDRRPDARRTAIQSLINDLDTINTYAEFEAVLSRLHALGIYPRYVKDVANASIMAG